jgi:hypothetical protein
MTEILERISNYDWEQAFGYAPFKREEVAEVIVAEEGEGDGDSWVGIFRLKDDRIGYLKAGCDYTGWDCQASGAGDTRRTLVEVVRELCEDDDRRRLKIALHGCFGIVIVVIDGKVVR